MHLPSRFATVILAFAPVFRQQRTWRHAEQLLIGAILAPGKHTVTSLLRIVGLSRERRFVNYHRVLNRAAWNARGAARLLLDLLIAAFVPIGPVVLGIDDTIERRRGKRIRAKGIDRDPVRSSKSHFVKARGLRLRSRLCGCDAFGTGSTALPSMAQSDAAGPDPLGGPGLGLAVPDRPCTLGALRP
jgi:DDE superfamily endonuclease